MSYQNSDIITVSDTVLSSQLGDESVILDHEKGEYFGLDTVGSFVWEMVQAKACTFEEVKMAVLEEFEVDEATAESDLQSLFAELKAEKLIQ